MKESIVSVIILVVFVSANLNHNYPFQEITNESTVSKRKTKNMLPQIHWIVNDFVTAQAIPIVFQYAEGLNTTIMTSWGNKTDVTLESPDRAASIYKWVTLLNSKEGIGNISVILNDEIISNHTVHWRRFIQPSSSPMSLSFTYERFSYYSGVSMLTAEFYPNGSALIDYTLYSGTYGRLDVEWFDYNHSFTYNIIMNSSIWPTLIEYLINNEAVNWQSWEYLPNAPYGDLGGWEQSLKINWNDSYQTSCHAMVDDDSGKNTRKLTNQEVENFFGILMAILDDLIEEQMKTNDTTTVSTTNTTTVGTANGSILIYSLIIFLVIITFRRKRLPDTE